MCGIVGFVSNNYIPNLKELLQNGCDAIAHRGPDHSGLWVSDNHCVGFGHRRLSIIDLTPAGHQPMADISGQFHITFNGEIYNYQDLRSELISKGYTFRSSTDTEIILNAYKEWGKECVNKFVGMFSFAIFDVKRKQLFIARDRTGEKPLFYRFQDGRLSFASELKALFSDPLFNRKIDPLTFEIYLAYGYIPGNLCIISGVNKLPPAHILLFDLNRKNIEISRYWNLPEYESTYSNEKYLVDELEWLLSESIRNQLIADVPVGILLSGGLDSSLTTALAAREITNVKTFTIRFPGHDKFDETHHARLIANHFGTEHIELEATSYSINLLPLLAHQFDEPIVDSSIIPTYLVSKLVREHCTVALGGDGGDELFGGYGHYSQLLNMKMAFGFLPYLLRKNVGSIARKFLPTGLKGRNWLKRLDVDYNSSLPIAPPLFDFGERSHLLGNFNIEYDSMPEKFWKTRIPIDNDLIQRATRMDFENYLTEDILVKVDRASMLNSLELRSPWLDHRLIEFAFSKVPSNLKVFELQKKILPKKLAQRILPKEFDLQRKQGFSIPLKTWLENDEWHNFFKQVLLDSPGNLFNPKALNSLLKGQSQGRSNTERLFALVFFELWRNEYKLSI